MQNPCRLFSGVLKAKRTFQWLILGFLHTCLLNEHRLNPDKQCLTIDFCLHIYLNEPCVTPQGFLNVISYPYSSSSMNSKTYIYLNWDIAPTCQRVISGDISVDAQFDVMWSDQKTVSVDIIAQANWFTHLKWFWK